jgi:hypothetical protein
MAGPQPGGPQSLISRLTGSSACWYLAALLPAAANWPNSTTTATLVRHPDLTDMGLPKELGDERGILTGQPPQIALGFQPGRWRIS